jgi:Zn finger protein HypA/HybF involved in hydrogenase expression
LFAAGSAGAGLPAPDKVGGPESCAECHFEEIEAWKKSAHNRTFNELHRKPDTAAMLARLGLSKIKTERQCMECHYLNRQEDGALQATNGISCESCHGAGQDWAKTHGDYGEGVTKITESAGHRNRRRAEAVLAGMITPDNLYALGASCYQCHVMNDEKIVNVGGHPPLSDGFNFLTWSQGEVRHTMLRTDYKANPEATPAHRRRLFVLGLILEVEYGLRAVARASERGAFGLTIARRTDAARRQLEAIQSLAPTAELGAIVPVAQGAALRLNNAAALAAAADKISALGRQFAEHVTGEQLAGIDQLVPDATQYRGKVHAVSGTR